MICVQGSGAGEQGRRGAGAPGSGARDWLAALRRSFLGCVHGWNCPQVDGDHGCFPALPGADGAESQRPQSRGAAAQTGNLGMRGTVVLGCGPALGHQQG